MNAPAYPINVFWSAEDEAWVADVPDVTYCSATGATPHDAVAEVEVAIEVWREAARTSGHPVPTPSRRLEPPWRYTWAPRDDITISSRSWHSSWFASSTTM